MAKNIFAHTEPGGNLPGYISINRHDDGRTTIGVRTRGQQYASELEVTPETLEALLLNLIEYLYKDDQPATTAS